MLTDDVRRLLIELEERSAEAQALMHTMPLGASHSLMEWEVMRERVAGALEGIQHESETGNGLHGRHGAIAMARSLLDTVCTSPESVAEWHPISEPAVAGENGTGPGGASAAEVTQDIQVLDLIRHMAKVCQDSLNQCDDLVRLILRSVGTYTNDESEQTGKWLLDRLAAMNNSPLTLGALGGNRSAAARGRPSRDRLKKLVGIVSQDVFSGTGELAKQPNVYALWGTSSGEDSKSALLDLLKGSSSRIDGTPSPKIEFGELKTLALEYKWGVPRSPGSSYVELLKVAPFGIQDVRFQELGLRAKAAFLMVFPGEMEKFDSTAARKYVAMLDAYKKACGDERVARKSADGLLKKAGHVAMFAGFTNLDYDEQFPERGSPQQVAFLSHQVEQFQSQLKSVKDASAAEAAEAASKLEEEQEAAREAECCRGLLKFLSAGGATLEPATREQLLGEYLASRGGSSPGL